MVRIHPDPPEPEPRPGDPDPGRGGKQNGAVAQLGERLLCKQEAVGSIPSSSTSQAAAGSGGVRQQGPGSTATTGRGSTYRLRSRTAVNAGD